MLPSCVQDREGLNIDKNECRSELVRINVVVPVQFLKLEIFIIDFAKCEIGCKTSDNSAMKVTLV